MNARIPLLPHQQAQIDALKVAWIKVGECFANRGSNGHCEMCANCETRGDLLPYGEGYALDAYDVCTLGERPSEKPTDCPAYVEAVAEEARAAAWQAQGEAEMAQGAEA